MAIFELTPSPSDLPSSLEFHPSAPNDLIVSSWDRTLRYYRILPGEGTHSSTLVSTTFHRGALLDCAYNSDGSFAVTGGLDRRVNWIDLERNEIKVLGKHNDAVKSVVFSTSTNSIISGSWDKTLLTHDPRTPSNPVATTMVPHKIFTMDLHKSSSTLVVGMANRTTYIYDVRKMGEPWQRRESSLKFMTRCVRVTPDGQGYASSSIEGRIALEYFSPQQQHLNYAFKCHRTQSPSSPLSPPTDTVYPVNALTYHPIHGTFASGGGDGNVSMWDSAAKKRLKQYPGWGGAVQCLEFSHQSWGGDGSRWLAVCVGVGDDGSGAGREDGVTEGKIMFREFTEAEGKPKTKTLGGS